MKRFLILATVAVVTFSAAALAVDVGLSVNLGQPGFYGRLDPSGYPQPQVIYRQPRSVQRVPQNQPPVYMRVPRNQSRNWSKHCGQYNACGDRVLFVQDKWYKRDYAPRYQEQNGNRGNNNNGGQGYSR
jgi:hypothetical protein